MRLTALLLGFLLIACSKPQNQPVNSLDQAKQVAQKTGKPILLDFMTDW